MSDTNRKYKIICWGMGATYNQCKNALSFYEMTQQIEIIGITAKERPSVLALDNISVISLEEIKGIAYDYIIVFSQKFYNNIVEEAEKQYGIGRDKFINGKVLLIPNLKFADYIKLKESNISIVSNNCWGGIVCNTLGIQCRSPFKNLFVLDDDYIKLLKNLRDYMEKPLCFERYSTDIHNNETYPVFKLDDIEIHCNHSGSEAEALEDWNRRVKLINYNNLFIEMYTESEKTAAKFCNLKPYKKKICFVPFQTENQKSLARLPVLPGHTEFWQTVNSNAGLGNNGYLYNLIDLLLYARMEYRVMHSQEKEYV